MIVLSGVLLIYSVVETYNVRSVKNYYEFALKQQQQNIEDFVAANPLPFQTPTAIANTNNCPKELITDYSAERKKIIAQFSDSTSAVSVSEIIDNYAHIWEHAIEPYHGGDWCVVKKECGSWVKLFCSQDSVWCGLEETWGLPKGLLGECVPIPSGTSQ